MSENEIVGHLITACHKEGQAAFARRTGISQSLVSMTISGRRAPCDAIANALGYFRRVRVEYEPIRSAS